MIERKEIGRVIEICKKSEAVGDEQVSYRLIKLDADFSLYLLLVSNSEEKVAIVAGREEAYAKNLFDAFVDGKVSPCTANDLFKDIILQ